jgi:SpoVK/Ycf46/Vps4 family AAA+-type ATPase
VSREQVEELALLVRAGWRAVALETFEEDRALRALGRAAAATKRALRSWSCSAGLAPDGAGAGSLDACVQALAGVDEPALFALLDAQHALGDAAGLRRLRDRLPELGRRKQLVVFVGPALDVPVELEREVARVRLSLPAADELRGLFEKVVEGAGRESAGRDVLDACVRAALGLTAGEAARAFRKAWLEVGRLGDDLAARIVREKRQALHRTPALTFHEAGEGLAEVGGLGELKAWLRERRQAFGDEARRFGLPAPRGLLLLGVQGCGKSLCAKAVAREWQFPLLRVDLAAAFGDPTRSPELAVREAIAVAESLAPAVLWIDEIEKGFAVAGSDGSATRTFGSFLTWMAEKRAPVFVVATANDVTRLPPELLRRGRFDELFFVDLPEPAERAEILAIHLRKNGRDPVQYPLEELAAQAERLSGAELEQVVAAGLYKAFAAGRELAERDLADAITETVPLYETYEERIKELRNWARHRARPASSDARMVDLFQAV